MNDSTGLAMRMARCAYKWNGCNRGTMSRIALCAYNTVWDTFRFKAEQECCFSTRLRIGLNLTDISVPLLNERMTFPGNARNLNIAGQTSR